MPPLSAGGTAQINPTRLATLARAAFSSGVASADTAAARDALSLRSVTAALSQSRLEKKAGDFAAALIDVRLLLPSDYDGRSVAAKQLARSARDAAIVILRRSWDSLRVDAIK